MFSKTAGTNQPVALAQATDYYPFGKSFENSNVDKNHYLYNDKELKDQVIGSTFFGWYDYGARFYDPELGRWHSVDPLAEKYRRWSPYNYCVDNPIKFTDPDGMSPYPFFPANYMLQIYARMMEMYSSNNTIRQIGYAYQNPSSALHIKSNLSVVAVNFQINIGNSIGAPERTDGSPQNALRHTLWQALSARDEGGEQAERAANSHETTTNINLNQREFKNLEDADRTIDFLNNDIGRNIGEKNEKVDNKTMAIKVVDEYRKNGLWTAKPNKNGGFMIQKTKLTPEQYKAALEEIKKSGEDGKHKKQ